MKKMSSAVNAASAAVIRILGRTLYENIAIVSGPFLNSDGRENVT